MTEEYCYQVKIPKDRIAVLIGKSGETKLLLESETNTNLIIDSKEGDVSVKGSDPLYLMQVREIIQAIGRGFNPEIAQLLLKQDYGLEIIPLSDYARNKPDIGRIKSRLIGTEGKTRKFLEMVTETNIVIYGKTVAIIGKLEGLYLARRAVLMLINGSPHSNVYKWLERQRKISGNNGN